MEVFRTSVRWKQYLKDLQGKRTIGLIPTMGYLHDGHFSLAARAGRENDIVAMSVFVNPLQFGPSEDFERYPRDEARDLAMMERAGVDAAFVPAVEEMYPSPDRKTLTTVSVSGLTGRLCGASRPGHFDGVATVVMKLLNIIEPTRVYFGLKDAQQVAVVQQMVSDLNHPAVVVPCPTLREADGLAMSSRNVYLTPEQRRQAPALHRALSRIDGWLSAEPGLSAAELEHRLKSEIAFHAPQAALDYAEVLTYPGLQPALGPVLAAGGCIAAVAVFFGKTRLIDNRLIP